MTAPELAEAYLGALGRADLAAMLSLFSEDAVVHPPLYGPVPAALFFPAPFRDTAESRLTLRGVMQGTAIGGTPLVSIWFHFDWQLPSGRRAPFDVVDVLELEPAAALRPCASSTTQRTSGPSSNKKPAGPPGGPEMLPVDDVSRLAA